MKKLKNLKLTAIAMLLVFSLALAACGGTSAPAAATTNTTAAPAAQEEEKNIEWPTGTVKMVVSASAGGGTDISARTVLLGLEKQGNFIVENNTDGNGVVAWESLKQSDPAKMQELLYFNTGMYTAIATGLSDIDPINDIVPFWSVKNNTSYYIAVPKDSEFNSVEDIVKFAKANPGTLQCGVCPGDIAHIMMGDVAQKLGIFEDLNWVATGTDADRVTLLMGNNIDVTIINELTSQNYAESGEVKFLASIIRHPAETVTKALRDLPTLEELGYENCTIEVTLNAWAPAGASHETYEMLFEAFNKAYTDEDVVAAMKQRGSTPAELYGSFDEVLEKNKSAFESLVASCQALGLAG